MDAVATTVVVATSDHAFFDHVQRALTGMGPSGASHVVHCESHGASTAVDSMIAAAAAVILDERWPEGMSLERVSTSESLDEVVSAFEEQPAPPAVRLIRQACEMALRPVIIVCAENPSLAFTQVALAAGVDWVWSSRTEFSKLQAVVSRLRELKSHRQPKITTKPRVLVVENAQQVINGLRTYLQDEFDLSFVNAERRRGNDFSVSPAEAIEHYHAHGPFAAAIIDLALTESDEETAKVELGTQQATIRGFFDNDLDIGGFLGGLVVIQELLARDPGMTIAVFSNHVDNTDTMNRIRLFLQRLTNNVAFYSKKASHGYRDLHRLLVGRHLEGTDQ